MGVQFVSERNDLLTLVTPATPSRAVAVGYDEELERLAVLGRASGKLNHEVKNLITGLLGYLQVAQQEISGLPSAARGVEKLRYCIDRALAGAEVISDLVSTVSAATRGFSKGTQRVDVNAVINSVLELAGPSLGGDIVIELQLGRRATALGNHTELIQVLLNLLLNATDALGASHVQEKRIQIVTCSDDKRVYVSISDNGVGIPEESVHCIFERDYTTKGDRGRGFGLATAQHLVQQLGGWIGVESQEGAGTNFSFCLPVAVVA